MDLPLDVSLRPMEARSVDRLPEGEGWQYEPKYDGFRCLAFRDGDEVDLRSKSSLPMARYFPDIVDLLRSLPPKRFVLDGELVVPVEGRFDFEELQLRLHPAASRVAKLAAAHPASYVVFDLLVDERGRSLAAETLAVRRAALEQFFAALPDEPRLILAPAVDRAEAARRWLDELGPALDGLVAKRRDAAYAAGERTAMQKWKRRRTADCVVAGFRYGKGSPLVGSLLLGLYDDEGRLDHVGFTSTIKASEKPALTRRLEALVAPPGFTGRAPGGPSRWSTERSGEWQPLRPELVAEVCYDHVSGGRFRHGTSFLRWRPDKAPAQCGMSQIA